MHDTFTDQRPGAEAAFRTRCGADAQRLNSSCFCISLDREALDRVLEDEVNDSHIAELMRERCPHVFSERPVFIGAAQQQRLVETVQAIETVVAMPAWRELALALAPAVARHDAGGAKGVFFGYDFHAEGDTLGLIEINTNAGGAMLNAMLARAQRACCADVESWLPSLDGVRGFEQSIIEMFRGEWQARAPSRELRTIAIVDESPETQYLYPEFLLFQRLFEAHGITAVIADPAELALRAGTLWLGDTPVDLVYNRLTDFYLEGDNCRVLREAYLSDAVVLTPHPQAHALYADKRRLATLTDPDALTQLGVPEAVQAILLRDIPHTTLVRPDDADALWADRRNLFFKPVTGYGSRGAYRGDKLTKRVWQEILDGDYIAQKLVQPGERHIDGSEEMRRMKFDLRAFAYAGKVQWTAARVYQGQTTNFRTPGGGFAPVYTLGAEQAGANPRS
jgi:hypothetical protein